MMGITSGCLSSSMDPGLKLGVVLEQLNLILPMDPLTGSDMWRYEMIMMEMHMNKTLVY